MRQGRRAAPTRDRRQHLEQFADTVQGDQEPENTRRRSSASGSHEARRRPSAPRGSTAAWIHASMLARSGAGGHQPEGDQRVQPRFFATVRDRKEAARRPGPEVRHGHFTAEDEGRRSREQTEREHAALRRSPECRRRHECPRTSPPDAHRRIRTASRGRAARRAGRRPRGPGRARREKTAPQDPRYLPTPPSRIKRLNRCSSDGTQ